MDFEHGLHAAVNKLRRGLGDSAENPRYIETVHGRGYRFIGTAERPGTPIQMEAGSLDTPQAMELRCPAQPGSALVDRICVAADTWLGSYLGDVACPSNTPRRTHLEPADQPFQGSDFTFGTQAAGLALSPDGKTAAYVATENGKVILWVRALDATSARPLIGTEDAGLPFWSPDSKSIAFLAKGKLQRVFLAGGTPQIICEVGQARGGAWSDDGRILFGGWNSGLFQVVASGGHPSAVTTLDRSRGEIFHYWPQILPGGRFLYFIRSNTPENSGVYAGSFANPRERVQLLATDTNALYTPAVEGSGNTKGYLLWLRGRNAGGAGL